MPPSLAARDLQPSRLSSAGLAAPVAADVAEAVAALGAVQAQELHSSAWGVGQRVAGRPTVGDVHAALADGSIVRTHVLRPTWHYATPEDLVPFMVATADRVARLMTSMDRAHGIDTALRATAEPVIVEALRAGPRTRAELREWLAEAGVPPVSTVGMAHLMMHAELDLLVGSGPMRGRQPTYRLLDVSASSWTREEAERHLARRYVAGHGPCRAEDLAWWASLPVTRCRQILADADLTRHERDGVVLWTTAEWPALAPPGTVRLLSVFDEFFCHDFKGWEVAGQPRVPDRWTYAGLVVLDGVIVGAWSRLLRARHTEITVELAAPGDAALRRGIEHEAERYAAFLGLEPRLAWGPVGRGSVG